MKERKKKKRVNDWKKQKYKEKEVERKKERRKED